MVNDCPDCDGTGQVTLYSWIEECPYRDNCDVCGGTGARSAEYAGLRADGWPLCPRCGEDELFSLAIPASADAITGCYRCNWRPNPTPPEETENG